MADLRGTRSSNGTKVAPTTIIRTVNGVIDRRVDQELELGNRVSTDIDNKTAVDSWAEWLPIRAAKAVSGGALFDMYFVTKTVAATAPHVQVGPGLVVTA